MGVCYECSIDNPIPSIPRAHCNDGRSCIPNMKFGYAEIGILSYSFIKYNPVSVAIIFSWALDATIVLIVIGVTIYVVLAARLYYSKRDSGDAEAA